MVFFSWGFLSSVELNNMSAFVDENVSKLEFDEDLISYEEEDPRNLATSYVMYKIGKCAFF